MSVYKTSEGKQIITSHYKALLKNSPVPITSKYVKTKFGSTHYIEVGSPLHPSIVMIHGSSSNSAMWLGDMAELMDRYHIIGVDILGEPGLSDEVRLNIQSTESADWLHEVIQSLHLSDPIIVGNSLGGWLSLNYANQYPSTLSKLVLIASSGIVPPRLGFVFKSIFYLTQGKKGILKMNQMIFDQDDIPKEILDTTSMILKHFKPRTGGLPIVTDDALKKITCPVTFIAGENDCTLDVKKAVARLKEKLPHAETRVIKNNGHVVYNILNTILE